MEGQILQPTKNTLEIEGKMSYSEHNQAWNTIRFKKELISEFHALRDKRSNFSYKMVFYRSYNDLEKAVRKIRREKLPLPLLLFMNKERLVND